MTTTTLSVLAALVLSAEMLAAQSAGDAETLKLLRQTIADQKRHPDKVIRTYTNLPPVEVKSDAPASDSEPAPVVVAQSKPKPAPESNPAPAPTMTAERKAAAAELERQYLSGKLSERKYKKALEELDNPSKAPAAQTKPKPTPANVATPPPTEATPPKPSPGQAVTTPTPPTSPTQPAANQKRVSEVETKIDDMIRQKEAREAAAKTNAPPVPGAKMTKRQRLDFLLKQVIDGKLSDAEYKKEREKILAEPE